MKHAKLLAEVLLTLGKIEFVEQHIRDPDAPKDRYYGVYEDGVVWMDPKMTRAKKEAVTTLIHEALHHCRPKWSENRVRKVEAEISGRFTKADVDSVYKLYRLVVKKRRGQTTP